MGFDYNFDRDEPKVLVPVANRRRRWVFTVIFAAILILLLMLLRPGDQETGDETPRQNDQTQAENNSGDGQLPNAGGSDANAGIVGTANFNDDQKALAARVANALNKSDFVAARQHSLELVKQFSPFSPEWFAAAVPLGEADTAIMMKRIPCDKNVVHTVKSGDTLKGIANRYNDMSMFLLRKVNGLEENEDHISIGDKLTAYNAKWRIEISLKSRMLAVYDGDELFKVYKIGVSSTHAPRAGEYLLPFSKKRKIGSGGERSGPYGTHFMGFKNSDAGIHGCWASDPQDEFREGSIRLANPDIEELYLYIPGGTKVKIID